MRKNVYKIWKDEKAEELKKVPIRWAFDDKQLENVLNDWGLTKDDLDQVYSIGCGGLMRKVDIPIYKEYLKNYDLENKKQDKRFFVDMLLYELNNHEYGYTRDLEDTLDACQISAKDLQDEKIVDWINETLQIWKYLNGYDEYSD